MWLIGCIRPNAWRILTILPISTCMLPLSTLYFYDLSKHYPRVHLCSPLLVGKGWVSSPGNFNKVFVCHLMWMRYSPLHYGKRKITGMILTLRNNFSSEILFRSRTFCSLYRSCFCVLLTTYVVWSSGANRTALNTKSTVVSGGSVLEKEFVKSYYLLLLIYNV